MPSGICFFVSLPADMAHRLMTNVCGGARFTWSKSSGSGMLSGTVRMRDGRMVKRRRREGRKYMVSFGREELVSR